MIGIRSILGWPYVQQLIKLLKPPPANLHRQAERIQKVEVHVMLPVKCLLLIALFYYIYLSQWVIEAVSIHDVAIEFVQTFFLAYTVLNIGLAFILLSKKRFPVNTVQWLLVGFGIMDGLILSALTLFLSPGGLVSIWFWFFPALIVRHALSLPLASQQITVNLGICLCYFLSGVVVSPLMQTETTEILDLPNLNIQAPAANLLSDPRVLRSLGMSAVENPTEFHLLRLIVLIFMTFICYGLQILMEKQRLALAEAREFAMRQEQLNAAGRISAEIAHQIKNPLSIINNAAYNLQKFLSKEKEMARSQVEIIREEVERADRIITELMGYAKLADGRVEKLNVVEELNRAIEMVIPEGQYDIEIRRCLTAELPCVMMQRGHLSEIFVNLLKNAREALDGKGCITISSRINAKRDIEVVIEDNGPGIPPERIERVFEAYYTTKSTGTGLGLAIARHALDIYGGKIQVESVLGNGARFILTFPANTLLESAR